MRPFFMLLTEDDSNYGLSSYINIGDDIMTNCWMAIASSNHVDKGVEGGFVQVCHGKSAQLKRVKPNDRVVYYSPTYELGGKKKCQCFTAIGVVKHKDIYQVIINENFRPFRRDITWDEAKHAAIRPILNVLDFSADNPNWGYQLRFGLLKIPEHDFNVIMHEMKANIPAKLDLFS